MSRLGNLEVDFSLALLEYMYKADTGEKIPIFPRKEICSTSMDDYEPNPYYNREKDDWYNYQTWILGKIKEVKGERR